MYGRLEDGLILNAHCRLHEKYISVPDHSTYADFRTFCLFPESSRSASSPPGPKLLLRLFFTPALSGEASTKASGIPFSLLPMISDEGTWAIDLRERKRGFTLVGLPWLSIIWLRKLKVTDLQLYSLLVDRSCARRESKQMRCLGVKETATLVLSESTRAYIAHIFV